MDKAIKIVNNRDKLISKSIAELSSSLPDIQKEIWKKMLKFIQSLDTDSDGNLKTTSKNLKAASIFINKNIKSIINNSEYPEKIEEFIEVFDIAAELTNDYFKEIDA